MTVRSGPDITRGDETARDSFVIGTCTVLSRAAEVVRVAVVTHDLPDSR